MDIATLVGVAALIIERSLYYLMTRVRKTKSECSGCCETEAVFDDSSKSETNNNLKVNQDSNNAT